MKIVVINISVQNDVILYSDSDYNNLHMKIPHQF